MYLILIHFHMITFHFWTTGLIRECTPFVQDKLLFKSDGWILLIPSVLPSHWDATKRLNIFKWVSLPGINVCMGKILKLLFLSTFSFIFRVSCLHFSNVAKIWHFLFTLCPTLVVFFIHVYYLDCIFCLYDIFVWLRSNISALRDQIPSGSVCVCGVHCCILTA